MLMSAGGAVCVQFVPQLQQPLVMGVALHVPAGHVLQLGGHLHLG